jgi:hypothetical protein
MDLNKREFEDMDRISLDRDRHKWEGALVNLLMNVSVPNEARNVFL